MTMTMGRSFFPSLLLLAAFSHACMGRTFTIKNSCSYTIWPALYTASGPTPDTASGWEAETGSQVQFTVENTWNGRIWARTGCDFGSGSTTACVSGDCGGGDVTCTNTGAAGATLAEFNLYTTAGGDYYDVSNVDGFNLPMSILNDKSCPQPTCPTNLLTDCPAELAVKDASGNTAVCLTACTANLSGDNANSPNCCTGSFNTPATCPSSGVQDYSYFKTGCPNAYAYAYDESSESALWKCDNSVQPDYTIVFCPAGSDVPTSSNGTSSSDGSSGSRGSIAASAPVATATVATVPVATAAGGATTAPHRAATSPATFSPNAFSQHDITRSGWSAWPDRNSHNRWQASDTVSAVSADDTEDCSSDDVEDSSDDTEESSSDGTDDCSSDDADSSSDGTEDRSSAATKDRSSDDAASSVLEKGVAASQILVSSASLFELSRMVVSLVVVTACAFDVLG